MKNVVDPCPSSLVRAPLSVPGPPLPDPELSFRAAVAAAPAAPDAGAVAVAVDAGLNPRKASAARVDHRRSPRCVVSAAASLPAPSSCTVRSLLSCGAGAGADSCGIGGGGSDGGGGGGDAECSSRLSVACRCACACPCPCTDCRPTTITGTTVFPPSGITAEISPPPPAAAAVVVVFVASVGDASEGDVGSVGDAGE